MEVSSQLASALWHLGGLLCHQLPDRSPHFQGAVFPQCFRCAGLYLGLLSSFVVLAMNGGYQRRLPDLRCALWISILTVPLMVDGWANMIGLWSSPGWVRALTGVGVGLVLPLLLVPLAHQSERGDGDTLRPTLSTPARLLTPLALSLLLLWGVVSPTQLWMFIALAVAASCAPAIFLLTFLLAGWRNRALFAQVLRIASPNVPC
jgi:uncharacterized membrane protein